MHQSKTAKGDTTLTGMYTDISVKVLVVIAM